MKQDELVFKQAIKTHLAAIESAISGPVTIATTAVVMREAAALTHKAYRLQAKIRHTASVCRAKLRPL